MKVYKRILFALWAIAAFILIVFLISWITGSDSALAWGYIAMLAWPIVGVVTAVYIVLDKVFPNGKLF